MLSAKDLNVGAICVGMGGVQDFLALDGGEVSRLSASESIFYPGTPLHRWSAEPEASNGFVQTIAGT